MINIWVLRFQKVCVIVTKTAEMKSVQLAAFGDNGRNGVVIMKMGKNICIGLLAHVDAGKTTLAESMLYQSGRIRRLGRVDHRDTFLDTDAQERERGITIFSKQAELVIGERSFTLLDTPGHVDFSAEMERTLQVLDYAILIVSGADGVQGHVETLWKLLAHYQIPLFVFVNKMDQEGTDREAIMRELRTRLSENCMDFSDNEENVSEAAETEGMAHNQQELYESLALCDEAVMEYYLEHGTITRRQITDMIRERRVFPCYFGSALKLFGVAEFMEGLLRYTESPQYPEEFGARVFKITRDAQGKRLTHMKITGGTLRVKELLSGGGFGTAKQPDAGTSGRALTAEQPGTEKSVGVATGEQKWQEKADQIRIYSGTDYEPVKEAAAGTICAVTGLTKTFAGEGLGREEDVRQPILEPVLNYKLELPEDCNVHALLGDLRQLEEEEPLLHIRWEEETGEIHAQLMGEVQIEVLCEMIRERYGVEVAFGNGSIVYKETITEPVEGVGHFEPLRHYAEVHLLLEPGEPGSGLTFSSVCSEDVLEKNWQRLVLTHLEEKQHRGVLTGSEITDMRITLLCGRAHPKHTEGGDFRQATYRAVRQGLRMTESRLLEPVYEYRLELPADQVGRAMADIQRMHGTFREPEFAGMSEIVSGRTEGGQNNTAGQENRLSEMAVLTGTAPAATIQGYQREVTSYTRGRGHLSCSLKGYEPCHNEAEVIASIGYEPERDLDNPTGSVFCAHGAGFVVEYDKVYDYMHLEGTLLKNERKSEAGGKSQQTRGRQKEVSSGMKPQGSYVPGLHDDKELDAIFQRTYGDIRQERRGWARKTSYRQGSSDKEGKIRTDEDIEARKEIRADRGMEARKEICADGSIEARKEIWAKKENGSGAEAEKEYLLVDGYNIIFGWEELSSLARLDIGAARNQLMDILCNYQGYRKVEVILVFDAYKVEGNPGSAQDYHNIHVVYTKEAETADQYIEKVTHRIARKNKVTVATSDALEQVIILGQGAQRMSAQGLRQEVLAADIEIEGELAGRRLYSERNYLLENLPEDMAKELEEIRLGKAGL